MKRKEKNIFWLMWKSFHGEVEKAGGAKELMELWVVGSCTKTWFGCCLSPGKTIALIVLQWGGGIFINWGKLMKLWANYFISRLLQKSSINPLLHFQNSECFLTVFLSTLFSWIMTWQCLTDSLAGDWLWCQPRPKVMECCNPFLPGQPQFSKVKNICKGIIQYINHTL